MTANQLLQTPGDLLSVEDVVPGFGISVAGVFST